jgi:SET domain-containing protein
MKKHKEENFEIKTSSIPKSGKGVFSLISIKKGDTIGSYIGRYMNDKEFDSGKHENNHYILHICKNCYIDAEDLKKSNYTRFINHSKKPNCRFVVSTRHKTARVEALRNIKIGEELYLDYGPEFFINDEKDNSK